MLRIEREDRIKISYAEQFSVVAVYEGAFDFRHSLSNLTAVSTDHLPRTVILHMESGHGPAALAAGELLIDTTTATTKHLSVGSVVPVTFAQTGSSTLRIGGIFQPNGLLGSYVVGDRYFLAHYENPLPVAVLLNKCDLVRSFVHASELAEALRVPEDSPLVRAFLATSTDALGAVEALAWLVRLAADRRRFLEGLDKVEAVVMAASSSSIHASQNSAPSTGLGFLFSFVQSAGRARSVHRA